MLKKEEDDLKDAILFFTPDTYTFEDQCALCGQLMGISEFLKATLSKSAPCIFRFEYDKFALKRTGAYTFGLKGGSFTPDSLLKTQLTSLYETFITFHGSVDSLKLRCKESTTGFLQELNTIWRTILAVSRVFLGYTLSQTFQAVPYIQLPKSGTHLFLQAAHLLQSSQRRPCVLAGTILYKNRVLSTQLPPTLTNQLTYLQNKIPHILRKTVFDLPVGCTIVTVFLTDEELSEIVPLDSLARHHCKITDFSICRESDSSLTQSAKASKPTKSAMKRRLTCPSISLSNSVPEKALHSYLTNGQRRTHTLKHESVTPNNFTWSPNSKVSLSHVPIVECKHGESPNETDADILPETAEQSHFSESYKEIVAANNCDNEQSETDSEDDDVIADTQKEVKYNIIDKKEPSVPNKHHSSDIAETHFKDIDEVQKSEYNDIIVKEDFSVVNDLSKSMTKIEKNESVHVDKCSEIVDLVNTCDNIDQSVVKNELGFEHNALPGTDQKEVQLPENETDQANVTISRKWSEENPSISDFEDDVDEIVEENLMNVSHSRKEQSCILNSENVMSSNTSMGDGIEDKVSFFTSSETSAEIKTESNPTGVVLSSSSSEGVKSRFYDCLTDTETKTLAKDSNHTIHHHTVSVHRQDSFDVKTEYGKSVESGVENSAKYVGKQVELENVPENMPTASKSQVPDIVVQTSQTRELDNAFSTEGEESPFGRQESEISQFFEDSKENMDPNISFRHRILSDSQRYESEIETEDEGFTIATIEPCINCLELASKQPDRSGIVRCSRCIEQFNKRNMFRAFGDNQEVIDFQDSGRERYESGTDVEGSADFVSRGSGQGGSQLSSLSSDVSTDSTISRYWTNEMDGLNDCTLYVQCHSDISLLLLMETPEQYEETLFHSLWKGSLAHLADLDYQIKECIDSSDDEDLDSRFRYLKHDMFAAHLEGSMEDPGIDRKSNNLHQMLACLHTEFQQEECLSDVTLRSHFNGCYGHSNHVEETYFQSDLHQKLQSGFPVPKDPVFSLDVLAQQYLANEKHLSLL